MFDRIGPLDPEPGTTVWVSNFEHLPQGSRDLIDLMAEATRKEPPREQMFQTTIDAWAHMWTLTPEQARASLQERGAVEFSPGWWQVTVKPGDAR